MLLNPIQNDGKRGQWDWKQVRPVISQLFGKDFIWTDGKPAYARFGMKGHNGIDFKCKVRTPIYAPCDGFIAVKDSGRSGYGLHVKIRGHHGAREIVLAHLSKVVQKNFSNINMGDLVGYSGNTGFSTGAHLHLGLRFLEPVQDFIFMWRVKNYNNGYLGYEDPIKALITFKGGIFTTTLMDLQKKK